MLIDTEDEKIIEALRCLKILEKGTDRPCVYTRGLTLPLGAFREGFMKALGGTERQKALKKPCFVEEWPRLGLGSENHGRWKIFQV